MAIESVGSSASASVSVSRQPPQTQQVERREPPPEQRTEQTQEAPRPVKNAEGQTTGTRINTSA